MEQTQPLIPMPKIGTQPIKTRKIRITHVRYAVQTAVIVLLVLLPFTGVFHVDLSTGRFVVFGYQVWWSDFFLILPFWLFVIAAMTAVYAVLGMVYCGWACIQNTFSEWTNSLARFAFGSAQLGPGIGEVSLSAPRPKKISVLKKGLQWSLFLGGITLFSLLVSIIITAYVIPPRILFSDLVSGRNHTVYWLVFGIGGVMFLNLLGSSDPDDDVDLIATVSRHAQAMNVPASRLLINSMGCPNCRPAYREILVNYLVKNRDLLCETCQRRTETNPLRVLDCKVPSCQPVLEAAPHLVEFLCPASRNHFEQVCRGLEGESLSFTVTHRLVRGLDYYTETAFEWVSDALGAQSTWAAGGRYNGLVRHLGGADVPGVGLAIGLERLLLLRELAGTLPQATRPAVHLAIHPLEETARPYAHRILAALRNQGISAVGIFGQARIKKAFLQAEREGALFIGLLGGDELSAGTITLKHLGSGIQKTLPAFPPEELAEALRAPWTP